MSLFCRTLLLSDTESSSVAEPEQLIVMPFNFSTVLERNLSASWYREIPTIKVDAKLDDLKVFMNGDVIFFHVCHAPPQGEWKRHYIFLSLL